MCNCCSWNHCCPCRPPHYFPIYPVWNVRPVIQPVIMKLASPVVWRDVVDDYAQNRATKSWVEKPLVL